METLWFCLVAIMIAGYVVLDGFDIGRVLCIFSSRARTLKNVPCSLPSDPSDGNEVWLLAGGGTLYFAFPALYASSFSGFYLPIMIVLWLLIVRGISIEFRGHIASPVWTPIWDAGFAGGSLLLAIFYGAALGNVVRGVPLDASGYFFLPLWTDFRASSSAGILDWYTILTGVAALLALTMHGALWIAMKTPAPMSGRSALLAFLSSCAYLVGMLTSAAFGVYPLLLPACTDPALSLTVANAAAGSYGLHIGLAWFIPGMLLSAAYATFTYRRFFAD